MLLIKLVEDPGGDTGGNKGLGWAESKGSYYCTVYCNTVDRV